MPENMAAYLEGDKVRPLVVKPAPYTAPGPNQILVQTAAVAVNPLEQIKQDLGSMLYSWVKYPFVMGSDVAGTVVEVGAAVTRFKAGDRVVGHALGMEKKYNNPAMGGFQHYVLLVENMVSPIPASLAFEKAAVLPLGLSTASCGLFQKDQLALRHPTVGHNKKNDSGQEVVLVWGGSTSVGCNAIQLACAAGYEVVTTCSPRNFDLVKSLGARAAFDYNSDTAVREIAEFCREKPMAGAISMGGNAGVGCVEVLRQCRGNRFLSMVSFPTPKSKNAGIASTVWCMASFFSWLLVKSTIHGIRHKFVWGSTLEENEVSRAVYEDFLPRALARDEYATVPEPEIVGKGLEFIQPALDKLREGVSARKLVVTL